MYDGFNFDSFFDLPDKALPPNCEYYFNVLFIAIEVPEGSLNGIIEFNDMSHIKDSRPVCLYFYEGETKTWNIEATPHTVVEFNTKTREVCWYDMLDFETKSPWKIDPIEEDFDYDDDDDEYE